MAKTFDSLYRIGERVQAHPATDAWMMGDRYGEVVKIGKAYVHVKMDKSRKVRLFPRAPSELNLLMPI